uniref:Uncharacterized protein n=1 Tax=Vitis vinifera TaxID=29760 RepID=A5C403_VITVI|nr:hypothetical protein VITISV_000375 [Vitis vinifera]
MEQDALVPKVAPRTCSNQGRAKSSTAFHGASPSTHSTSQEMNPMSIVLQRLDSQDTQLREIQGSATAPFDSSPAAAPF